MKLVCFSTGRKKNDIEEQRHDTLEENRKEYKKIKTT
jgi:hypothetical protein